MNNQFIVVTLDESERKQRINILHIVGYVLNKQSTFTWLELSNSNDKAIKETPEQIDKLINPPKCDWEYDQ